MRLPACVPCASLVALLPLFFFPGCADTPTDVEPARPGAELSMASLAPGDFTYTVIRHPEGDRTYVNRINTRGEIVGDFRDATGRWDGFLARSGQYRRISFPGSNWTYAYGLNERGDVVGVYNDGTGPRGYLYTRGTYERLNAPEGYQTRAFDINASGTIVGSYRPGSTGPWQPAMWSRGVFVPLSAITDLLGASMAEGFGINGHGAVVGHYTRPGDSKMYGFVYRDAGVTTLNVPGSGSMSCAWGLGEQGHAVGHYVDGTVIRGYLWQDGSYATPLEVPGATLTWPSAFTSNGMIAGYAIIGGQAVGFVATRR